MMSTTIVSSAQMVMIELSAYYDCDCELSPYDVDDDCDYELSPNDHGNDWAQPVWSYDDDDDDWAQEEEETNSQLANSIRKQEQVRVVMAIMILIMMLRIVMAIMILMMMPMILFNWFMAGTEAEKGRYWADGVEAAEG